jgi:hypothetical protein
VLTGALEIYRGVRLRRQLSGEWRLVPSGILSIVFGGLEMAAPAAALAIALWIGAYAIAFGGLLLALAFDCSAPLRSCATYASDARCRYQLPQVLARRYGGILATRFDRSALEEACVRARP